MTTTASSLRADLASYIQLTVADYIHMSATTLLVYDTLLTASREVTLIWTGGFWGYAVLYVAVRYSALSNRLMMILERLQWPGQSAKSCTAILWLDALFLVATWLSIAAFSALRVYAISGKRIWLLIIVLCFGLVLPAAELYQIIDLSVFVYKAPRVGCGGNNTIALGAYQILATAARASAILSDLLVLVVTLLQTYKSYRPDQTAHGTSLSLTKLLCKDGSIYFLVLFLFNLFDIIFLQLAINGALADIVTVLSVILVARFLLHLRQIGLEGQHTSIILSSIEVPQSQFASVSLFDTLGRSTENDDVNTEIL